MIPERIGPDADPAERALHEYRYAVAARYVRPGDVVVDAGCGIGYGEPILRAGRYVGLDRSPVEPHHLCADLETWEPDFDFDVFVALEVIEHLADYSHLVEAAHRARRCFAFSAPIVPTMAWNPWHKHDFTPAGLKAALEAPGWSCVHSEEQRTFTRWAAYGILVFERLP